MYTLINTIIPTIFPYEKDRIIFTTYFKSKGMDCKNIEWEKGKILVALDIYNKIHKLPAEDQKELQEELSRIHDVANDPEIDIFALHREEIPLAYQSTYAKSLWCYLHKKNLFQKADTTPDTFLMHFKYFALQYGRVVASILLGYMFIMNMGYCILYSGPTFLSLCSNFIHFMGGVLVAFLVWKGSKSMSHR